MHHARPGFRPPANAPADRHRWELDSRHGHAHFYPSPGYPVTALPHGHRSVRYSGRLYYFYSGIWYQPTWYGYTVIRPPLGLVLPILPLYYSIVWFGGVRYYYANDVYYLLDPDGYRVVAPPTGSPTLVEQPPSAAATDAGPFSEGTWYYCQSSGAYYPHVSDCSVGWQPVPAAPPAASILPGQSRYPQGTWYWCDASTAYYPYATECASGWRTTPASTSPR